MVIATAAPPIPSELFTSSNFSDNNDDENDYDPTHHDMENLSAADDRFTSQPMDTMLHPARRGGSQNT